jgi:hypothetical protein
MALGLFGLQFWMGNQLLETAFVVSARFLFWWYLATGLLLISLAALIWAGDLGTEGARLRHGVVSALSWMMGVPRMPLHLKGALYFLMVRRLFLGVGAYFLVRGLQPAGATFAWDERLLWAGGIALFIGLITSSLPPLLRRWLRASSPAEPSLQAVRSREN